MATYIFPGAPALDLQTVRKQIIADVGPLCEAPACNHSRSGHYIDHVKVADESITSEAFGWETVLHPGQPDGNGLTTGAMNTDWQTKTTYTASWAIFHSDLTEAQLKKLRAIMVSE